MSDRVTNQELGTPTYITELGRDFKKSGKKRRARDEIREMNELARLRREEQAKKDRPPQPREKVNRADILSNLLGTD